MRWFLVVLALLPFLPALNAGEHADIASVRILIPLLLLSSICGGLFRKRLRIPVTPPIIFCACFFSFAALSYSWSQTPDFTIRKTFFFFSLAPVLFLAAHERARNVVQAFVVGATISACAGIVVFVSQFLFGSEKVLQWVRDIGPVLFGGATTNAIFQFPSTRVDIGNGATLLRAFFPFPDPHTAALFWGMAVFCALAFSATRWRFVAAALLIGALFMTFSRGGILAFLVTVVFFSTALLVTHQRAWLQRMIVPLTLLVLLVTVIGGRPLVGRIASTFNTQEGSNAARLGLWAHAGEEMRTHPVLGLGLGGFSQTVSPSGAFRVPANAHSTYLEIGAELGSIGLLLLVATLGSALIRAGKRAWGSSIHAGVLFALVFFCIHAVFEVDLYSPAVLVVLLSFLAIAAIPGEEKTEKKRL